MISANSATTNLQPSSGGLLAQRLLLLEAARREQSRRKQFGDIDARCAVDALYWLRHLTLTENEQWEKEGLPFKAAFPDKKYFDVLFEYFAKCSRIFVPKSRDMMTSWSAVGWGTNKSQFKKATVVVQTESEEKAKKLLKYADILWDNQPDWMKERYPLEVRSTLHLRWRDGGEFFGIPCGETKIRIHHPTIYILDEAAFLPGAQSLYNAAHPVAGQIIGISSAQEGWFMNECAR
jgi:hypothetical protein